MAEILELIDKQDNSEIILAQIVAILAIEKAEQVDLATTAGKPDPELWNFALFKNRSIPWAVFTEPDGEESGDIVKGLVSAYHDTDGFENPGSDNLRSQKAQGQFILDCYGHKSSTEAADGTPTGSGDELAMGEADRVARLVRNILMAEPYTYLKLGRTVINPGTGKPFNLVQKRYTVRRENLRPNIEMKGSEHIAVVRLTLRVDYVEFGPLSDLTTLDTLIAECERTETGEIYFTYEDSV